MSTPLIEAALKVMDKMQEAKETPLDYGDTDEASSSHEKHADKNKPNHQWKDEHGNEHSVWHHTSPKGTKTTLYHIDDGMAAPLMKFNKKGHHTPEQIKTAAKEYD
jgi:hypothetical protein